MKRVVEEWDVRWGPKARTNPLCLMLVEPFDVDTPCNKPATVRVNYWPHWSEFWCPKHAAGFGEPREFRLDYFEFMRESGPDIDEPTFIRHAAAT